MGYFIPRPTKRPLTPSTDGVFGSKTFSSVLKYQIHKDGGASCMTCKHYKRNDDGHFCFRWNEPARLQFAEMGVCNMYESNLPVIRPGPDYRYNCPNCCAAINGPFCEYCGTVFERVEQKHISTDGQVFTNPIYIGNEQIDQVVRAFDEFHDVAHNIGR